MVLVGALAEVRLEDRLLGLLELEDERVAMVPPEQEGDPGARPDAADADDLARHVDEPVAVEEPRAVVRQRGPIRRESA